MKEFSELLLSRGITRDGPIVPFDEDVGEERLPSYERPLDLSERGLRVDVSFNPLFQERNGVPLFDQVKYIHLASGMSMIMKEFTRDYERFLNSLLQKPLEAPGDTGRLRWQQFATPFETLLDRVDVVWGAIGLLREVMSSSLSVHRAYHELVPLLNQNSYLVAQSEEIHNVLQGFLEDGVLSETRQRIADRFILEGLHNGVRLTDVATLKAFDERQEKLVVLANQFATNVATDEAKPVQLLEKAEDVAWLPQLARAAAAAAAANAGHEGAEEGRWLLTGEPQLFAAVMEYCPDRSLRRRMYEAHLQRGWRNQSGGNSRILRQILQLRKDWASPLGYSSYAEMAFSTRMASFRQAEALLDKLLNASLPAAHAELEEVNTFAQVHGEVGELEPWDLPFWRRSLQEEKLGVRAEDVQEYLELPRVVKALFTLVCRLFDVEFMRADGEAALWREDVKFFILVEPSSKLPVAGLYFDPHVPQRPGRLAGFWADAALSYSRVLGKHGQPRRPIVHIVGDVPRPPISEEGQEDTAKLSFSQVRSLFRAMGRALQDLLTTQAEGLAAGTKLMELDAVEFLPRFMEFWAYEPATLQAMGLSEEVANAVAALRSHHVAIRMLEDVRLAQLDLRLHAAYDPENGQGVEEVVCQLEEKYAGVLPPLEERTLCGMEGVYANGYGAGHYAALWAEVLAADAFEAFLEVGLDDVSAVRQLGLRLREEVLAPGSGRAPLDAFRGFRGRIPRVAPALRLRGLAPGALEKAADASPA